MFCIAETQIGNISARLGTLGRELSDWNEELELQIFTQNSDIGDLREILRNLTEKQG